MSLLLVGDYVTFRHPTAGILLVGNVICVENLKQEATVVNYSADTKLTRKFDFFEKLAEQQLEVVKKHELEFEQQKFYQKLNLLAQIDKDTLIFECKRRGILE